MKVILIGKAGVLKNIVFLSINGILVKNLGTYNGVTIIAEEAS